MVAALNLSSNSPSPLFRHGGSRQLNTGGSSPITTHNGKQGVTHGALHPDPRLAQRKSPPMSISEFMPDDSTHQPFAEHNHKVYQHLKTAVSLNLRRQFFIAVCDNLNLRNQLAMKLHGDLTQGLAPTSPEGMSAPEGSPVEGHHFASEAVPQGMPQFVNLMLDLADPNPVGQIATWLHHYPQALQQGQLLGFQILGIEGLTRQVPAVQRLFLSYLRTIERNLPRLNCSVLLWVTRPWANTIRQTAPECWNWSTGIFEFAGDPVPLLSNLFDPHLFPESTLPAQVAPRVEPPPEPPTPPPVPATQPPSPAAHTYAELRNILEEDLAELDRNRGNADWLSSIYGDDFGTDARPQAQVTPSVVPVVTPAQVGSWPSQQRIVPDPDRAEAQTVASPQGRTIAPPHDRDLRDEYGPSQDSPVTQETPDPEDCLTQEVVEDNPLPAIQNPLPTQPLSLKDLEAQVQRLRDAQAPLDRLAQAHLNLGRYYRQRIEQGEVSREHLQGAIGAYEQVLEWLCFSEVSPEEMGDVAWPDILNDLGTLYWLASRNYGNSEEGKAYLQQAVQAYQLGLKKISEVEQPRSYAMLQNNLGTVYSDLTQWGETFTYLERAIEAYQAALRHRRPDTDPLKFAATQNNLGTAYWHLAQHQDTAANLKRAINAYNQALRYYRPDREPGSYAMIQNNLGTAYWNLSQCTAQVLPTSNPGDTAPDSAKASQRDWLLLAVNAYQSALRFRTLEGSPAAYGATQNNLGTAYWHLANLAEEESTAKSWGDRSGRSHYLKLSIEAYEAALVAARQFERQHQASGGQSVGSALSFDRYATHNNLGLILYQSAMLTDPDTPHVPSENQLAAALHHHLQAWTGWKADPDLCQTVLQSVVQTIRTCYEYWGTAGQNRALNQVPGSLLPDILSKI